MRTNRRDVMRDAQGSQQLVEEHTSNLLYKLESLLDDLIDAEDTIEEQAKLIDSLENELGDLEAEVQELHTQLAEARG